MFSADSLAQALGGKRSGTDWIAHCPAHDDRNPSLSISESPDGKVLVKCHAGCTQEVVIAALKERGLWGEGGTGIPPNESATLQPQRPGCTLAQYAKAKGLPVDFLRGLGLSDMYYQGSPAIRIPYRDSQGNETAVRFRLALDGDNRFRWKHGSKPFLYGLWKLDTSDYVVLAEGESDAHTLWHHGFPGLGLPGATNWRENRDASLLDGISTIYVVIEPDKGGEAVQKWLSESRIRDRAHLVDLGDHKDPSSLYVDDPDHFRERFQAALDTAKQWVNHAALEAEKFREQARERCADLARSLDILERFVSDLKARGVVGEDRAAKLSYLALTSRFLTRPVSVVIKGPSSGGKSFVTEQVLKFFPADAFYALSAMSEHALAYSEEPLKNRFIVIYEAAGLQSNFASYLMRSLLSEGRLRYETVEKTKDGMKPRLIEREGPTGLLVTTTAIKLRHENETRLLSIPINDTRAQTKNILRAIANEGRRSVDLQAWQALQVWLTGAEHQCDIRYARQLAEMIPPVAVRLRRDFAAILALIKAHAILHQVSRDRDSQGRIIATLDDYAVVRELVADLIAEGVEVSVSPTIRQTVEAIQGICQAGQDEATVKQVAGKLGLDESTTFRRIAAAIKVGYVNNLEERRGRPARLVLGDPLPEEQKLLPTVQELKGCTVAAASEGIDIPPSPNLESNDSELQVVEL